MTLKELKAGLASWAKKASADAASKTGEKRGACLGYAAACKDALDALKDADIADAALLRKRLEARIREADRGAQSRLAGTASRARFAGEAYAYRQALSLVKEKEDQKA